MEPGFWPTDPLLGLCPLDARKRVDKRVRLAIGELPSNVSRNAYRASTLARRLGLNVPLHRTWCDNSFCRRYVLALRMGFEHTLSFGLMFDKGRRSGNDWIRGNVMGYETFNYVHLPPIVALLFRI